MLMKIRSIQVKMMLCMAICGLSAAIALTGYTVLSLRKVNVEAAHVQAESQSSATAAQLKMQMETALNAARNLASTYALVKQQGVWLSRQQARAMLKTTLESEPHLYAVMTIWEPDAFDNKDKQNENTDGYDATGQFIECWARVAAGPQRMTAQQCNLSATTNDYLQPKATGADRILEPQAVVVDGAELLLTRLVTPVLVNGKFYGVVMVDVDLRFLQNMVGPLKIFNGAGQVALVSNTGSLIGVSGAPELVGKPLEALYPDAAAMRSTVRSGLSDVQEDAAHVTVLAPVTIGGITTPWSTIVRIPMRAITAAATRSMLQMIAIAGGLSVFALGIIFLLSGTITRPIRQITAAADALAQGVLLDALHMPQRDEVGQLASAFNILIASQRAKVEAAERIAANDLTVDITPISDQDRLGLAMAEMVTNMRQQVLQIRGFATSLNDAALEMTSAAAQAGQATTQIAATMQQIAHGVGQQAVSTTQTAASADQMTQAIYNVSSGAQQQSAAVQTTAELTKKINTNMHRIKATAQASSEAARIASVSGDKGKQTVQETITRIDAIQQRVGQSAQKVREMGERSKEIGAIVEAIEDIAAQTNLLALNATIEAARAGEHGKGFAVVADEVRKLSERAAAATKQISALVRSIRQAVGEAVSAMDESAAEVQRGVDTASQAGRKLDEIMAAGQDVTRQSGDTLKITDQVLALSEELVGATNSVSAVVQDNTAAAAQMSSSAAEVTSAMENIASISQENSAAVEEASASAEQMSAQVQQVSAFAQSLSALSENMLQILRNVRLETDAPVEMEEQASLPLAAD